MIIKITACLFIFFVLTILVSIGWNLFTIVKEDKRLNKIMGREPNHAFMLFAGGVGGLIGLVCAILVALFFSIIIGAI